MGDVTLGDVRESIGVLSGKMDLLIDKVTEHIERDDRVHEAQGARIGALETNAAEARGETKAVRRWASFLGGCTGAAAALFIRFISPAH